MCKHLYKQGKGKRHNSGEIDSILTKVYIVQNYSYLSYAYHIVLYSKRSKNEF